MNELAALRLKKAYHKPEDDIAADFYLPAISVAKHYDRAVGFFSSSIYLLAWKSLKQFVANGGRMRLICSPVLSDDDNDAVRNGYSARAEAMAADRIREEFDRLLASPALMKPAVVLASLVAANVIDFKLAWIGESAGGRSRRLFHDKVGLLSDDKNRVVFKGSMNETWPGLSLDGNLESVDVFVSWEGERERERIEEEVSYFERLWDNKWPGVTVVPLPESARNQIISVGDAARWSEYVDEISLEMQEAAGWSPEASRPGGRLPRSHQLQALESWSRAGRRGILEHATGSGKTFTALCAINDAFGRDEVPLIIVPSDLLLLQWERELREAFDEAGLQLLVCGGGHSAWRNDARLRTWTRRNAQSSPPRAVLSTLQTASSNRFIALCSQGEHLFMVADEVHRLGAEVAQGVLGIETGPRLGLSATPERAGDPEGTKAIFEYFGGVLQPPFGIKEAVKAGALTPYAYHVHPVNFNEDEQMRWQELTDQYRQLYARSKSGAGILDPLISLRLKNILIQRARVVKTATGKVSAAVNVLRAHYRPGQRWIVYCDDQMQLDSVRQALLAAGLENVYEYHSAMIGDRAGTLAHFNALGGIVVSIRCLDEGVDIPAVSHALILASSRNPREFIQRRGRVLRRSPGKGLAFIHDLIVIPHSSDEGDGASILSGEIARAIEFGSYAINPASVADLKVLAAKLDIDWAAAAGGIEIDEDNEESADQLNGGSHG